MSGLASQSTRYEPLFAGSCCDANHIFRHANRDRAVLSRLQLFYAVGKHARYSVLAHPWIFNAGEMLTGFAAIVGALGL